MAFRTFGRATLGAALLCIGVHADAATLAEKAKESGCVSKPKQVEGTMYKCDTTSGASSYFNVPDLSGPSATPVTKAPPAAGTANGVAAPARTGFPRVDAETQKGRDDVRRRVLQDELATEEKLLAESRASYAEGAPTPLPEERASADKYRDRIARLRQAVVLHERNIEALKKEIGGLK
ncbi:MAG: DUF4124 domain-containing protein [Casimicrobiaceae bacterium]